MAHDKTTVERIHFTVDGDTVVGDLHLPAGGGPHPAVIVAGPMTSVKEQVTGVYAAALAARSIAGLALDHRHFGESDGVPRQCERSDHKVADLVAALEALADRPDVDARRLGAVGVCLGAGYAAAASVASPRVRALGMVAGYYRDVAAMQGDDPEGFEAKRVEGVRAREHYEQTGEVLTVPAAALEGDAAMRLPDTYEYYATPRAGVANYANAFAVMSREHFLVFDVQRLAPQIRVPVAMVHSECALSPSWARKFHDALTVERTIEWLDSANQVDFYDQPHLVEPASDCLATHLWTHLS